MDALVLFRSTTHPEIFGFTMDKTGANLPNGFAPWLRAGRIPVVVEVADRVKEAIVRDGFYLSRERYRGCARSGTGSEALMDKDECTELREHLDRCRALLALMRDPSHRKTIADLIADLEAKLAEMDGRLANGQLR